MAFVDDDEIEESAFAAAIYGGHCRFFGIHFTRIQSVSMRIASSETPKTQQTDWRISSSERECEGRQSLSDKGYIGAW